MQHSLKIVVLLIIWTFPWVGACRFDPVAQTRDQDARADTGPAKCGDGHVTGTEECDDGNNGDGDGCSATCQVEPGWICEGDPSVCQSSCGNGVLDQGEDCDGDDLGPASCASLGYQPGQLACQQDCTFDTSGCGAPLCGNETIDSGEECDEGGRDTATCDADCTRPECGDGHVNTEAGEACDDGQDTADCDSDCTVPECGDGHLNTEAGEICDDGNNLSGDGCSADCHSNETCGNSILDPNEACDEGGQDTTDCDSDCTVPECGDGHVNTQAGETCDASGRDTADCDSDCTAPECGDGHINTEAGEECEGTDLGGARCDTLGFDAGNLSCTGCRFDLSQCYNQVCGDGLLVPGEECDDGNTDPGDGCSDQCQIEPYFVCDEGSPTVCSCRVYVDSGPVSGSQRDGTSWTDAYGDIQSGIDRASSLVTDNGLDRCDVWVAEGDYVVYQDSSANTISLASHVAVFGGFDRTETTPDERDLASHSSRVSGCDTTILPCSNQVEHVLTADQVTDATIDGLTIENGSGGSSGGGLWMSGGRVFILSSLLANNAADNGGAIHLQSSGILHVTDTAFDHNEAWSSKGGAVWAESGELDIQGGSLTSNTADDNGGAIYIDSDASVSCSNTTFDQNEATWASGGAIAVSGGNLDIQGGSLTSNTADDNGGAIHAMSDALVTIQAASLSRNSTHSWYGGAIHCNQCSLQLRGCVLEDNQSGDDGGAIAIRGAGTASLANCILRNNGTVTSGTYDGGAIALWESNSTLDATACRFVGNHAQGTGGALRVWDGAVFTAARCWFEENIATSYGGGAIYARGGATVFTVTDSVFWKNSTESNRSGGAIRARDESNGQLVNCTFHANEVQGDNRRVGGVFARDSDTLVAITNSILWGDVGPETGSSNSGRIVTRYSDIEDRPNANDHVLSADPLFVDANNGNFELHEGSPCIDAADGTVASDYDLLGRIRWDDDQVTNTGFGNPPYVDMGALERQP